MSRLSTIALVALVCVPGVAALAFRTVHDPAGAAVGLAVVVAAAVAFAMNGRRVLAQRRSFLDGLHRSGATVVVSAAARASAVGTSVAFGQTAPLTVAAYPDRLDLWRMPMLGGPPALLRSIPWTDVTSVAVGDSGLASTPAAGVVVSQRAGAQVPFAVVANATVGSRLDPAAAALALERLRQQSRAAVGGGGRVGTETP